MNKIFLALLVFGFAMAAAQPAKQSKCSVNEKAVTNLVNLVDRVAKGQGKISEIFTKNQSNLLIDVRGHNSYQ